MFVGVMAFFARISDTSVGGTYMTLLNTFTNLGGNWPSWMALRFVSELTWTNCIGAANPDLSTCTTDPEKQVRMMFVGSDAVVCLLIFTCHFMMYKYCIVGDIFVLNYAFKIVQSFILLIIFNAE